MQKTFCTLLVSDRAARIRDRIFAPQDYL